MARPIRNPFPRSLLGQSLLAIAITLLIGQAVSAFLLYRAVEDRRDVAAVNAAAFHLIRTANRGEATPRELRRNFRRIERDGEGGMAEQGRETRLRLPPPIAGQISDRSPLRPGDTRNRPAEDALREVLARQGVAVEDLVVTTRSINEDGVLERLAERRPRLHALIKDRDVKIMLAGMRQQGDPRWIVAGSMPR